MFSDSFRDLTKPNVLNIMEAIKKSQGMTVTELSKAVELSYMGAKQQCERLEVLGYWETRETLRANRKMQHALPSSRG